jgi:hypothetical protein
MIHTLHKPHLTLKGNTMHTSYRLKCSVNGGRMYQHYRDPARRDSDVALLVSQGIIVETYEKEIEDAPAAPYVPTVGGEPAAANVDE